MDTESPISAAAPAPALPTRHEHALRFVGSGSEYFRIWIVNLLLTLVTFGLYYPFAKVRRLKYFHGATELAGQPFAFHADPWKMFRGYVLIAVMLIVYSAAGHFSPMAGLIAFVIVAAVWPALWHSSLRFRLANTSWRGLGFHFRGTAGGAYRVMAWPAVASLVLVGASIAMAPADENSQPSTALAIVFFAVLLAFWAAFPAFLWLIHRYRHDHMALGREHTRYNARVGRYYMLSLKSMLISGGPLVVLGIVAAIVIPAMQASTAGIAQRADAGAGAAFGVGMVVGMALFYVVLIAVAGGYWTARMQAVMWNGTASAHIGFASSLRARPMIGLWIKNGLLIIVTLGLYFPFAQVATARMRLHAMTVTSTLALDDLTARLGLESESAAGDAAGDLLGFDIGL